MPGGLGFSRPNLQHAPEPRGVGQQLWGQQQQPQQPQANVSGAGLGVPFGDRQGGEVPLATREANLRREAGKISGSGGDDSNSALNQAVGDHLTRLGGGHKGNPNPFKDREGHIRNLMRFMSETEAMLLGETL